MKTKSPSTWSTTVQMTEELGIKAGTRRGLCINLKEETHYYLVNPSGDRPTYHWHKKNVLQMWH